MRAAVTNVDVGKEIGMSHAAVSRIRSGHRLPSIPVMRRIAEAYEWGVADQIESRDTTWSYAEAFERVLVARYGAIEEAHV